MSDPKDSDPVHYSAEELLRDGAAIHIRSLRADDKERLDEHFHTLSPHSVYTRFFMHKRELSPAELSYFTEVDGVERVGLVVTLKSDDEEKFIGVGRYFRGTEADTRHRAEVAFAVSDSHQHRGIASILLDHLASIARAAGIREFSADVLGENKTMLDVFTRSGFEVSRSIDHGVYHVTLPTAETAAHRKIQREREREAAQQSDRTSDRDSRDPD